MANYTTEIRQMIDNPLIGLFTFEYNFYSDNPEDKAEFEKLFTQWYYFREIGFETPERFKLKLQAKLNVIMPYYRQLAMTEWDKVKSAEQMMTSKNLNETTTHEQTISWSNESTVAGESNQTDTNSTTQKQTTDNTQNQTSSNTQSGKSSNLSDGVSQASLLDGYLTSTTSSNDNGTQELTSTGTQELTSKGDNTSEVSTTQNSSGTNNQTLTETTTFSSVGDIGIQTPAYAITEWRKVLININQMIINECNDLFMKLY